MVEPDNAEPNAPATVAIGLGSNLGDPAAQLAWAVEQLDAHPEIAVRRCSPWFRTAPVGPQQPDFLNGVLKAETSLAPSELLRELKRLERAAGRPVDHERWGPRLLDLDLLAYGDAVHSEPGLTLPHPSLAERRFVLEPWACIAPDRWLPEFEATVDELRARIAHDQSQWVERLEPDSRPAASEVAE